MTIEFDSSLGVLYLRVRPGEVADTLEYAEDIYVDVDADGRVLGAEFLHADRFFALLAEHQGVFEIPEVLSA